MAAVPMPVHGFFLVRDGRQLRISDAEPFRSRSSNNIADSGCGCKVFNMVTLTSLHRSYGCSSRNEARVADEDDTKMTSNFDASVPMPAACGGYKSMPQVEDIVIVGGGIAGLATALALHRLGMRSTLVEQSDSLRTAGSAIGIWTNGWRALEALGVADGLREKFVRLTKMHLCKADGGLLHSMDFNAIPRDIELRAVERKELLEALKEPLPVENVLYNAEVVNIREIGGGYSEVELQNGRQIQTKILVGCDGVGSIVSKWMGFKKPRFVGYTAIRGLAEYPEGHNVEYTAKQFLGSGVRAGVVAMNPTAVYWFVVFNTSSGEKITDPELVRKEALNYVKGWPAVIQDMILRTSLDSLNRRAIADRWMWPLIGPPLYRGGVTMAGDALHPMTPNLGQGGCCALEDAIVLARALHSALNKKPKQIEHWSIQDAYASEDMKNIELALKSYTEERWQRVFPMSIRAFLIGVILQLNIGGFGTIRDSLISKSVNLESFVDHTFYDCGTL